ncbi:MAG TPA: hypothetical protein VKX16_01135 [Chloroflexota bacterium]|nr:hypothetical protein [Chloroflexota bacterium]
MAESDQIAISRSAVRRAGYTLLALVVLVVVIVATAVVVKATSSSSDPVAAAIKANLYQGVFLTNGEVYFGKLTAPGGDFYDMTHVYRLTAQPATTKGQTPGRQLLPITRDIQGPQDLLVINRSQILYVENLAPNGRAAAILSRGAP